MNDYEAALPARMKTLPRDKHGRPVPWFVAFINGAPDFRAIRAGGITDAIRHRWCWVCGKPMSAWSAFLIGPMCAVNRTTAEPPAHRDCAIYSATHCPFMTTPNMTRRDRHKPAAATDPAGVMIARNPGVGLVWITKRWKTFPAPGGAGLLIELGEPAETLWYAEGRQATRAEILHSIDTGMPILRDMAEQEGPHAVAALEQTRERALGLVPS